MLMLCHEGLLQSAKPSALCHTSRCALSNFIPSHLNAAVCMSGQMVYTVDVLKTNVAEAIEVLADSVLNPAYKPWEVS